MTDEILIIKSIHVNNTQTIMGDLRAINKTQ